MIDGYRLAIALRMRQRRATLTEISAAVGFSTSTISSVLAPIAKKPKKSKSELRKFRSINSEKSLLALRFRQRGLTYRQIGAELGVTGECVRCYLAGLGADGPLNSLGILSQRQIRENDKQNRLKLKRELTRVLHSAGFFKCRCGCGLWFHISEMCSGLNQLSRECNARRSRENYRKRIGGQPQYKSRGWSPERYAERCAAVREGWARKRAER